MPDYPVVIRVTARGKVGGTYYVGLTLEECLSLARTSLHPPESHPSWNIHYSRDNTNEPSHPLYED